MFVFIIITYYAIIGSPYVIAKIIATLRYWWLR